MALPGDFHFIFFQIALQTEQSVVRFSKLMRRTPVARPIINIGKLHAYGDPRLVNYH